jgi:hypothetical protein
LLKTPCTVRGMRGAAVHSGRRARGRPAPEGSQGRGARPRMSWGAGDTGVRPALGRTSGLDVGLLLRRVHAARREGNLHGDAGVLCDAGASRFGKTDWERAPMALRCDQPTDLAHRGTQPEGIRPNEHARKSPCRRMNESRIAVAIRRFDRDLGYVRRSDDVSFRQRRACRRVALRSNGPDDGCAYSGRPACRMASMTEPDQ